MPCLTPDLHPRAGTLGLDACPPRGLDALARSPWDPPRAGSYLECTQGTPPFFLTLQDLLHKVNIKESPDVEVKQLPAG